MISMLASYLTVGKKSLKCLIRRVTSLNAFQTTRLNNNYAQNQVFINAL